MTMPKSFARLDLMKLFVIMTLMFWLSSPAQCATLRVGPGQAFIRIADAAKQAKNDDIVEIMPGEYRGDVAVWDQKRLTIRGNGTQPSVLIASGKNAEGKAIWVIHNGDFHIENIEFRGSRVPDGNGAGIRFEQGRLLVRNCRFIDNQNGILTANFSDAELAIENSLFAQAPRQKDLPHLLYVGRIGRFSITGSRFHGGFRGHLIKSRARISDIRYNFIHDGPGGKASYEIDLPNGGIATLIGNIVGQSTDTQNPILISYGEEGNVWPKNKLSLVHNTLYSASLKGTWFLRVPFDKFPKPPEVIAINNLPVGLGLFSLTSRSEFHGNAPALPGMLVAPEMLDFSLPAYSPLRIFAIDSSTLDNALIPKAEFALPIGTRPLMTPGRWVPGALQSSR